MNPKARLVLTVSPVPLAATASGSHVLPATIYSKSVLRAAAQESVTAIVRAGADIVLTYWAKEMATWCR